MEITFRTSKSNHLELLKNSKTRINQQAGVSNGRTEKDQGPHGLRHGDVFQPHRDQNGRRSGKGGHTVRIEGGGYGRDRALEF
jgi:hypothetical protein